ncbi:MAG TPA: hypothetical protein PKM25_12615 [Candidatus Ozemobacteraceae bacterium]|nr:hypothetical protein [Candidatus Ozemobacteraceae bacterium]
MRKILIGSLFAMALSFSGAASAEPFKTVLVNGMQYESALASSAIAHTDICAIPYGPADNNVGGDKQDAGHRTEGAPTAFRPVADGSFWLLDTVNQKMKHFAADGKLIASLGFPGSGGKNFVYMRDLAVIPTGGFYLYNSTDGIVERVDAKGVSAVQIEGLPDSSEIGVDSKGNMLVANPVMQSLLRFNPEGELIEKYDGQTYLSPVVDSNDRPLGVKFDEVQAELVRADTASPVAEVSIAKFPLELPKERKAHYVSAKLIGSDARHQVYLELVACDDNGVIHQQRVLRLSSEGKVISQADLLVIPYLAPDMVRHLIATPDGKLFGFRSDGKAWIPISYVLP